MASEMDLRGSLASAKNTVLYYVVCLNGPGVERAIDAMPSSIGVIEAAGFRHVLVTSTICHTEEFEEVPIIN